MLSAGGTGAVVAGLETLPALGYYSFTTVFVPALTIAMGEALTLKMGEGGQGSWSGLLVRGWMFALGGVAQERLSGVGRTVWWIQGGSLLGWVSRWVGPSGVDLMWGVVAAAVSQDVLSRLAGRAAGGVALATGEGDQVAEGYTDDQSDADPATWDITSNPAIDTKSPSFNSPSPAHVIFSLSLALLVLSPYLPTLTPPTTHPSHTSPAFTYPPVTVACVAPDLADSHRKGSPASDLEGWLAETRRIGARARVVSWSEGAVRLDKGEGKEEELWRKVAGVADQYGVSTVATRGKDDAERRVLT